VKKCEVVSERSLSNRIVIEGVIVRESTSQSSPVECSDNVHISWVKTLSFTGLKNSCGFNMWLSRDSSARNSFYYGGDDALNIKTPDPGADEMKYLSMTTSMASTLGMASILRRILVTAIGRTSSSETSISMS
jgi:hypothetical protein